MADQQTILIVDDDPDFRLQYKIQLEAAGYAVVEAESKDDALASIEADKPVLVIQDLMMEQPDTGFTLCHKYKQAHPDLPVIMITGVTAETGIEFDATTPEERSWVKADAVLAKPIRFEQLQQEMDRLLG